MHDAYHLRQAESGPLHYHLARSIQLVRTVLSGDCNPGLLYTVHQRELVPVGGRPALPCPACFNARKRTGGTVRYIHACMQVGKEMRTIGRIIPVFPVTRGVETSTAGRFVER